MELEVTTPDLRLRATPLPKVIGASTRHQVLQTIFCGVPVEWCVVGPIGCSVVEGDLQ